MRKFWRHLPLLASFLLVAGCGGGGGSEGNGGGARAGGTANSTIETPCSAQSDPRLQAMSDAGIQLTSSVGLASGRFALPPTSNPTQLVVMFHGSHNNSCSWRNHLRKAATEYGAVAVAMDYTGQRTEGDVENYGWFMRAGAADSIAATKYFLKKYPSITQVFVMGISMGGNASGVAIASPDAVREDGSPLFDYWVSVEGVHNLIEEYLIIRAVAPGVKAAAVAQKEMEEENGGTIEQVPDKYAEITNVLRAEDMAYLKGAIMVHAIDDGLVPTTQSREMTLALNLVGVPTHLYTVGGKGDGEAGTTATGIVMGPLFAGGGREYESPFAGHGWEGSETHIVTKTGFEKLYALMSGATTISRGETPVPGF